MAVRIYSPEQAGRIIDARLRRDGWRERTAMAQLVRPGNIAADLWAGKYNKPMGIVKTAVSRTAQIEIPELIDDPRLPFSIMVGELTVSQGRRLLSPDRIAGHNADLLQLRLKSAADNEPLTFLNLKDCHDIAKALGKKWREMTDAEWDALPADIREQMTGTNWFWIKSETGTGRGEYFLRSLYRGDRDAVISTIRYTDGTVRLVKDR
jgi:hypothetical protein